MMKEHIYRARVVVENYLGIISLLSLAAAGVIFWGEIEEKAHYLFLLYFVVMLANRIDARYSIGAALLLLFSAAVVVAQGKEAFANQLAIYAYYFLVAGVVLQLIEYIREGGEEEELIMAEKRERSKDAGEGEKPRFIAIASGKGGVGKTTLTANLGVALSRLGKHVIVVDMDIAMPNLEVIMGVKQPPVGLIDVVKGRLDMKQIMYVACDGVKVIPSGVILNGYTEENIGKIKAALGRIRDGDYILLDMPPGREAVRVLNQSYEMLLVVNPEKASVLDALNMKVIAEKMGIKLLGVVVNRTGAFPIELSQKEVEEALELKVVAMIPHDRRVMESYSEEVPFIIKYQNIPPSREVERLARKLTGWQENREEAGVKAEIEGNGFIEKLRRMFRRIRA